MKAALLYLKRAHVASEFSESSENLLQYDFEKENRFDGRLLRQKCAPYPDIFRNALTVEAFKRYGPSLEMIVWTDDDQSFTPEQVYQLTDCIDDAHPIVSGLYFALHKGTKVRPLVNRFVPAQNPGDDEQIETVWQYPRNQLVGGQAHVGMGFCAISTKPLVAWAQKNGPTWFDRMKSPRGRHMIEDSSFCARMRSIGCEIFVHTGIKIPHWKTMAITEETYDAQTALFEKEQREKELALAAGQLGASEAN